MATNTSNEKFNTCSLSNKLKQIKNMKWILDYNSEDEYSYEDLHKQIEHFCRENFVHLVVIHHYLTQIPPIMKTQINNIISAINESKQCKKLYFDFLKNFHRIAEFEEYETYIFIHRSQSIMEDFKDINEQNIEQRIEEIKEVAVKQKSQQLALLFNILEDNSRNIFVKGDIMQNLPQIAYWIKQNKNKPIKPLTNDDCEVIAGLIYNLSLDDMLDKLNFSSFVKNYTDINKIIDELPRKFHVQNLTQVVFRILLLKPYIWRQCVHENIVKAIKNLH